MLTTAALRPKVKGLPDLLNWGSLVEDGVVLCKDGSLLAGYYYHGPDIQSSTDNERNHLVAMANAALARLGAGWTTWTDAGRLFSIGYPPPELSHFPDPISRMIDAERRARFEAEGVHYENTYALILQYTPPLRRKSKLGELIYDDDKTTITRPATRILHQFQKALDDMEDSLTAAVRLERMIGYTFEDRYGIRHHRDELVNYLDFCLTGEPKELNLPSNGAYLDLVIGGRDLWPGDVPRIGDDYICCIRIQGFPEESYPGILDALDHQPCRYRWSSRMIYLDHHEAGEELKKYRRKWAQKVRGFFQQVFRIENGYINEDAVLMRDQAGAAIAEAGSGLVGSGYYTPVVVLMDRNRETLMENARMIVREIRREGFAADIETINTMEAWLGSLPGHSLPNVRRPLIHTEHLAHLLPLASVWTGREENPCPMYPPHSPPLLYAATSGATPMRISLHVSDVGHTLMFGPTGAGKTSAMATFYAQALRYPGASIWSFDYKRGLLAIGKATGGQHYDISNAAGAPVFCPLSEIDTADDLIWAEDWIAICFKLQTGTDPTPGQRAAIHRAMTLMQHDKSPGARTMTHFVTAVQDEDIRGALRYYTLEGALGGMLDAEQDSIAFKGRPVFEMEDLLALSPQAALPVLLYLFRRFEKSLTGAPTYLLLEEVWALLGHPAFSDRIRQWLKTLRSKNCAVVMATQSLSDAYRSGLLDVLLESCPTRIYLPNPEADKPGSGTVPGPRDFYQTMGLNEQKIALIKHGRQKRDYFLEQPEGWRSFSLALGPVALAFIGVSSLEDIAEINRLEAKHGSEWPFMWMQQKGVEYGKYQ